ncbi:MAG: serine hydrolase domain-containing protein [Tenuifilaceae bacterium]
MCGRFYKGLIIFLLSLIISGTSSAIDNPVEKPLLIKKDSLKKINDDLWNGLYGKISGIVIYHKSKMIFERYYGFNNSNTLHPISSVTKSITSLITGICLDKGFLSSIDIPIWKYFPEYSYIFEKDTIKKRITIRNLLNQTAGFEWDEWTTHYSYAGNSLIELSQTSQNWVEATLKLPTDSKPGTKFSYNSGNSQLIKEILQKSTGRDFEWLTNNYLFKPIGINEFHWDNYPVNGIPAWGGVSLTTRDMARFGTLVCNKGCWSDIQVVTESWIENSTKIETKNGKADYGLHWWITTQPNGNPLIYAAGYGDQFIYIAPDKKIVVAINGQNFTDYKWPKSIDELIKTIFSSIE